MKRCLFFLSLVLCVSAFLFSGCSQHYRSYPPYLPVQAQATSTPPPSADSPTTSSVSRATTRSTTAPTVPVWPQVILIGTNPAKVSLVYSELLRHGWDSRKITMVTNKGNKNSVRAVVSDGETIVIPTSNRVLSRGLCAEQMEMIQMLTRRNRGLISRKCCSPYTIDVRTWLDARGWLEEAKAWPCTVAWPNGRTWLDSINGPMIEEFKKASGWRYRYGVKKEDCIYFTDCIDSSVRLDPYQLPWGGSWITAMEKSDREIDSGRTFRVWRRQ